MKLSSLQHPQDAPRSLGAPLAPPEALPEHLEVSGAPEGGSGVVRALRGVGQAYGRAQIHTPEFKRWFGASKVVDATGAPLVVYHGTVAKAVFSAFVAMDEFALLGRGIQFTSSPEDAGKYASEDVTVNHDLGPKAEHLSDRFGRLGVSYEKAKAALRGAGRVMPVYLAIRKPLVLGPARLVVKPEVFRLAAIEADVSSERADALLRRFDSAPSGLRQWDALRDARALRVYRQIASIQGCDGLIVEPELAPKGSGATHYIVFDGAQIKSALGNCGAFDPNNPDIRA